MPSTSNKVYLITGASRGLGRGILETYAARDNVTIIAGLRKLSQGEELEKNVKKGRGSSIIPVQIRLEEDGDAKAAARRVQDEHGITKIDVLLASAGISESHSKLLDTDPAQLRRHLELNSVSVLVLIQAFAPLLKEGSKVIAMTSTAGSAATIANFGDTVLGVYGMSKSALQFLIKKLSLERPDLIAFVICPGWVQTDMGNNGAKHHGMDKAPFEVEPVVKGIVERIDTSTKESSGKYLSWDEKEYQY